MKHIVITGSVAVGKSYTQDRIISYLKSSHIDFNLYPEFIYENPLGLQILNGRFKGEVSGLTMQNYILDCWMQFSKREPKNINIYERLPDDAVKVFAKLYLSDDEYKTQLDYLEKIPILSYENMDPKKTLWISYNNNIKVDRFSELIKHLKFGLNHDEIEYIVIHIKSSSAYENYKKRNREGEFYTIEDLENLYNYYEEYTKDLIKIISPSWMVYIE